MPAKLDLIGRRFGKLLVTKQSDRRGGGRKKKRFLVCRCDCGKESEFVASSVPNMNDCGCAEKPKTRGSRASYIERFVGNTFGDLLVTSSAGNCGLLRLNCRCACGAEVVRAARNLLHDGYHACDACVRARTGKINSEKLVRFFKDAPRRSRKRISKIYSHMMDRCYSKNIEPDYSRYGGRGIRVCERWLNNRQAFYEDMGDPPDGMTLERLDVDGSYCCGKCLECVWFGVKCNCAWATRLQQANNRRSNKIVKYRGVEYTLANLCREKRANYSRVQARIARGMSIEDAIDKPLLNAHGTLVS